MKQQSLAWTPDEVSRISQDREYKQRARFLFDAFTQTETQWKAECDRFDKWATKHKDK